jgi:hypothetical protein
MEALTAESKGPRNVQKHCQEANQGLALEYISEEEPGMAHSADRATRRSGSWGWFLRDEGLRFRPDKSRFQH